MTNPAISELSTLRNILEELKTKGIEDGLNPVFQRLLNEVMKLERTDFLQAEPYERTDARIGYANGYKTKVLNTRLGEVRVQIPQVRGLDFYPRSLERGTRSEKALKLAIAEMYVKGVSTRKVSQITEVLCGLEISSTQVSRLAKLLDEELEAFRTRPLGEFAYIFLDARYEKMRHGGAVRDVAALQAVGINADGKPEHLGVSVSLSEAEAHWREFLASLRNRGLTGVELIVSDDHAGLKAARKAVFHHVPWQRCTFHLAQNAQAHVGSLSNRSIIAQALRDILNSPSLEEAIEMKEKVIKRFEKSEQKFTTWLDENLEESLTFMRFPRSHWKKIRTTNYLERVNQEIRRRTRVATLFPNEASCERLVTAVVMEINEEWMTGKRYINVDELKHWRDQSEKQIYRKKVA